MASSGKKYEQRPSPLAKQKAREAKMLLDVSPDQLPTIAALSCELKLNRVSLQAAFQALFGISIAGYGQQVKMRRIKELLRDPMRSLEDIAEQTGYSSGPALGRFFKQMEGVSPGVWRRGKSEGAEAI